MGLQMRDYLNSSSDNEINLRELFGTLWAYKLIIAITCALGVLIGSNYVLKADEKFTSTAIFKLDMGGNSILSLNSELGALAGLAGLRNGSTSKTVPIDQFMGRIFIVNLDKKLNFYSDPYFNTYNPNSVDATWKSLLKSTIGWKKFLSDDHEATWQGILNKYSKNVVLDETKDGITKIIVTHAIPQRAAEIANVIMDVIISETKDKKNKSQDQQLSYLSNTLAKALSDLELSQSNLKEFALKNSVLPLESFAAGSLQLEALREQLSRTSELHDAVGALSLILQNKTTGKKNYLALRQQFPIVDQVEFRRVLGQNEIISPWSWPEAKTVNAIFDTLSERKSRLQSRINASQIDAERSGLALQTYSKLEREAKVAEATYTVLIEQVKARSMAAGYRPDKTEIYEYASIPIRPSSPKRVIIVAMGAILGLFFGIGLSFLLAHRRDVYYSKESIKTLVLAQLSASVRSILPLRNKSLEDVNAMLRKKPYSVLRDIAVEINKSDTTQAVVTSSRAKLTSNDLARALACYMQSDSMKIAVIDFSSMAKKLDIDEERLSIGSFIVTESTGNVSILRPKNDFLAMELLSQRDFAKNVQALSSNIDLLFMCADNSDAISLLRALQGRKTFHITLARIKYTKSSTLAYIGSLIPIQGLLHD